MLVCLTHILLGGKFAARPLLDTAELNPVAIYTNYYCWHMVSIVIADMGVLFFLAAMWPDANMLAWVGVIFGALFSGWNMALYLMTRQSFRHWYELPQWLLFAPIFVLGMIGLSYG